jgi:hypothetical protein
MNDTAEKSPGCQHNSTAENLLTTRKSNARAKAIANDQRGDLTDANTKTSGFCQCSLNCPTVCRPIGLHPRAAHCWPLSPVQQPEMNTCGISGAGHYTVERVNLPNKVPLAESTDRRITGHLSDLVPIHCDKNGECARPSRCSRSLRSGVTATNNDNIRP